jgi:hypothetical protein
MPDAGSADDRRQALPSSSTTLSAFGERVARTKEMPDTSDRGSSAEQEKPARGGLLILV